MDNGKADGVTVVEGSNHTPNVIRAACRERLYKGLNILSDIANNIKAKDADRIRALDTLGRFGLGAADQAAVHIHGDVGALAVGVVHLPTLDRVPDEEDPDLVGKVPV